MLNFLIIAILAVVIIAAIKLFFNGSKCTNKNRLDGKVIIVTGANSGIGKATSLELAKRGAYVIMACRNIKKGQEAALQIIYETKNDKIDVELLDLADGDSIRDFANRIKAKYNRLDILVNNAAIMMCPKWKTKDGFEMQIGVNHFGHFLLTNLLLDLLKKSGPSRIISVSSIAHIPGRIHWEDINLEKRYNPVLAYSQSKLANILFTTELARRLKGTNVTAVCLHPGAVRTQITRHMGTTILRILPTLIIIFYPVWWLFSKSPIRGAQTTIHCCVDENVPEHHGKYFSDCKPKNTAKSACDPEAARKLWELSSKLVKLDL